MRVLILTQNYVPEPDTKMHQLAIELKRRGHTVSVLTTFPNYPEGKIYPGYRQSLWMREQIDGIPVVRVPIYADHSTSRIRRSLNYISFAVTSAVLGPFLVPTSDVAVVYHPPATLAIPAFVLQLLRRIPFLYEIQDLWPETLPATGMVQSRTILKLLSKLGTFCYRRASAITVISPGFKRNLVDKGVPQEKIHFMPNWGYEGGVDPVVRTEEGSREWGTSGKFTVVYAGTMGPAQGLQNLLSAAALLRDVHEIQFIVIGEGVERSSLEDRVKAENLTNVRVLPRQPMSRMPQLYAQADALLIHLIDDPLFALTIPGKTQSYLASGRALIVSVAGDTAAMVEEAGAGYSVPPSNPRALAAAVRKLYALTPSERDALGASGRRYYQTHLTPQPLIDRYERILSGIAEPRVSSASKAPHRPHTIPPTYRQLKRAIDLATAIVFLTVGSPLLLLIAAIVKLTSRGPILDREECAGRDGKTVGVLRFRTTVFGLAKPERGFALTQVGRFLSRNRLDGLPQFFNVLSGSMSVVGPRPRSAATAARYTAIERAILKAKPGITDYASLRFWKKAPDGYIDFSSEDSRIAAKERTRLALEYVNRCSTWVDLTLMAATCWAATGGDPWKIAGFPAHELDVLPIASASATNDD